MSTRKPKLKSKKTGRKVAKMGWGETNKNISTLRKLEKAMQDESEEDIRQAKIKAGVRP